MLDRLKVFIWGLYLSKKELEKREHELVAKKIVYYVKATSPGGILSFTIWEKVRLILVLLFLVALSLLILYMFVIYSPHASMR